MGSPPEIAVVIPSYRATRHVLSVLARIGPECRSVYVVDDACPDGTGALVERECKDPRVVVLRHDVNQGVGGATLTGYRAALAAGATILVKLDADGQMDPAAIAHLVAPILAGEADYTKGNRFFHPEGLEAMPLVRKLGNACVSFLNKVSSGYWDVFDPTNGFTALHAAVARHLPLDKIARRWFFESDLLFRLGTLRAVVLDVPMRAIYGDERSNIVASRAIPDFALGHARNTLKRIGYCYFLRNFNFASLELVLGLVCVAAGTAFGVLSWIDGSQRNVPVTSGTVMLAALPILLGVQLLLGFLNHDLESTPRQVLHRRLGLLSS